MDRTKQAYRSGVGVVAVELFLLEMVELGSEAVAAPGGGGQNDGGRVHRVHAAVAALRLCCLLHPTPSAVDVLTS